MDEWWDDVILGCREQQGCGFLAPESNPQAWYSCHLGSRKHPAKRRCCGASLSVLLHQVPSCGYVFGITECGVSLREEVFTPASPPA